MLYTAAAGMAVRVLTQVLSGAHNDLKKLLYYRQSSRHRLQVSCQRVASRTTIETASTHMHAVSKGKDAQAAQEYCHCSSSLLSVLDAQLQV